MTFELAIAQPAQISSLRRTHAQELEDAMIEAVGMLAKSLNVHKNLDGEQVLEITLLLIEKYWMLRPEEIFYVFKNAKTGKYGTVDYSLDMPKICTWIDDYIEKEKVPYYEKMQSNYSKNPDEFTGVQALLDTGAKDSRLLQQLNLPQQPKQLSNGS